MKYKIALYLLLLITITSLIGAFTDVYSGYIWIRRIVNIVTLIVSIVVICLLFQSKNPQNS